MAQMNCLQSRNRDTDVESKCMDTKEESDGGRGGGDGGR